MIKETLEKIDQLIANAGAVDPAKKKELLRLLGDLRSEVETLSETHVDEARSIVNFAQAAAHEATRTAPAAPLRDVSLEGLAGSARGFEASHPKLVETVDRICRLLAGIGI
ncbi:MAG: hypothetical protein A2902_06610 [Elusimicrobia bacterium RIFCSPLOWO2_01_FULL_64_13]|nr:MAG: hypothetical protein A2636_03015 [Elusimicrobia bacterium RIFCSPHIGHO2_01_FULL_64_10]OGR97617.1 MAG: hypothetical protein A2902_06610 [Elusimicrobia bacterium RIFCSPLOWO2_01_FULL_64_13]